MADAVGAELQEKLENPLKFQWGTGAAELPTATINGFNATLLIDLCNAIIAADAENKLGARYRRDANQARIILGRLMHLPNTSVPGSNGVRFL